METLLLEKKYTKARIHVDALLDALWAREVELELARIQIAQLQAQIEDSAKDKSLDTPEV